MTGRGSCLRIGRHVGPVFPFREVKFQMRQFAVPDITATPNERLNVRNTCRKNQWSCKNPQVLPHVKLIRLDFFVGSYIDRFVAIGGKQSFMIGSRPLYTGSNWAGGFHKAKRASPL